MAELLKFIAFVINEIHDFISFFAEALKLNLTDKDLHFWVIGVVGVFIFLITDIIFKKLSKLSVSVISFVYTFTVLVVVVFGLEIQQKITGRGKMEFQDVVYGLWGFIAIFSVYLCIRIIVYLVSKLISGRKQKGRENW